MLLLVLLPGLLYNMFEHLLSHLQVLQMACNMPGSVNCSLAKCQVAFKQLQLCLWSHVLQCRNCFNTLVEVLPVLVGTGRL